MNFDDFFADIDSTLSKKAAAKEAFEEKAGENLEYLRAAIQRLTPLAASYEQELRGRGLSVKLTSSESEINFTIRHKDGNHRNVVLSGDYSSNRIMITESFPGGDGKQYTTAGNIFDKSAWKDQFFEAALQKLIQDFIFYSGRHGGI